MNLTLLRIILGVLGLVPIFIGMTGMFSGLERLVSGCEFSPDSDGQYPIPLGDLPGVRRFDPLDPVPAGEPSAVV